MLELRAGQRVVITRDSKQEDTGRVVRMGQSGESQVIIASDTLKKQIVFEYSYSQEGWKHVFQERIADPSATCYKQKGAVYQIEGLD